MTDLRWLPAPLTGIWDWQSRGACTSADSDLFFHPQSERGSARNAREQRAKAVCRRCPVVEQCRAHAYAAREAYGVWGGLSPEDRGVVS